MKNGKVKKITFTSLFAAMIFALTMLHVPMGPGGYVHLGDTVIYIAGLMIGGPWAFLAAAIGAALADIASGFAIYALPSAIIKILIAVPFVMISKKSKKLLTFQSILFTIIGGLITILGYYLADLVLYSEGAIADIPGNAIQAGGSAILFVVLAFALDKANIKSKLKVYIDG